MYHTSVYRKYEAAIYGPQIHSLYGRKNAGLGSSGGVDLLGSEFHSPSFTKVVSEFPSNSPRKISGRYSENHSWNPQSCISNTPSLLPPCVAGGLLGSTALRVKGRALPRPLSTLVPCNLGISSPATSLGARD